MSTTNTQIAAVVQAAPVCFDPAATLDKLADLATDATAQGAALAVFPEAFIGGYPKGLDFGARLGMRSPAGRDDFRRYYDGAIDVPGPATEAIGKIAKKTGMSLVVGVIERDGGTLYCTVLFFNDRGAMLGKHRKTMPTALERLVWGFGDASTLAVVDTPLGRAGAAICWENYMPLLRTAMYAKGVQLWCAPTVDDRDQWQHAMHHIAYEGRCFVLSACQFTRRSDYPDDYDCIHGDDPNSVLIRGGSAVVSPLGKTLAGPVYDEETVLIAELDPGDYARGKYDLDVVGHYARPDLFRLTVDESPQQPVAFEAGRDDAGAED